MTRKPSGSVSAQILPLIGIKPNREIAAIVGCKIEYVRVVAARNGLKNNLRKPRKSYDMRVLSGLGLTDEVRDWLKAITPRDAKVKEIVRAILIDAYADAQEQAA